MTFMFLVPEVALLSTYRRIRKLCNGKTLPVATPQFCLAEVGSQSQYVARIPSYLTHTDMVQFPSDNPGAWLMHCHIAWHVADGLAVQFLESKDQAPLGDANWQKTCANWNQYALNPTYPKSDSGLKLL